MSSIYARKALLAGGWAEEVRFEISAGGIESIDRRASPADEEFRAGVVIPGICNAHSHAFQRALVGRAERRSPAAKDSFWTWREEMYRLAGALDADMVRIIARQVYSEMLAAGYTSVVEFHYLHHAGIEAIISAAEESGIRLTLVPILYERAGFNSPDPDDVQKLFIRSFDDFVALYEHAKTLENERVAIGIGSHSLRAVTKESIDRIAEISKSDDVPLHIHLAEQQREVDECLAHYKTRPARWLLDRCDVDAGWCLVHATHLEPDEITAIARCGAVVCLCPSTEANLGDGVFALGAYLDAAGQIAIGSDSHVTIDPFEELRWLEYGQRLESRSRNVSAGHGVLFERAASGGRQACGQQTGRLEPGAVADLVVLDDSDPMLHGHETDTLMDALVFSGYPVPVERVMVQGEWRVIDGRHVDEGDARDDYRRIVEVLR
ncbi:MAG: formimidoylglutamate deiminase [Woeseiaceae bacterium]